MSGRHRTVKSVDSQDLRILKNDPFLQIVHRASSEADMTAMINQMGITDPQHRAAMLGLMKLTWVLIRRPL